MQGGQDYFRFMEGTCIIACVLSSSVLFIYPLHKDSESENSSSERKEEVFENTIQPPLLVVFLPSHLYQFTHSAGGGRAKCSFMQLVWLLCAWIIWNDRNQRLFNNLGSSIDQLLDKVKRYSLWWLKANNVVFIFGFHLWWSSHLVCLGLG